MSAHLTYFLSRLRGVRPDGAGFLAHCPAHDDASPSLHVELDQNTGAILCVCRSQGCSFSSIVRAVGMREFEMWPAGSHRSHENNGHGQATAPRSLSQGDHRGNESSEGGGDRGGSEDGSEGNPTAEQREVASWTYLDRNGRPSYEMVRYEPGTGGRSKEFKARRPGPPRFVRTPGATTGSIVPGPPIYNLRGVPRILYNLPALLAASPGSTIYIVEGERKADALIRLGFLATCNPNGAGNWKNLEESLWKEALSGHRIVLLPDFDRSGFSHVQDVARRAQGTVASAAVLVLPNLPPKGDVIDWLADSENTAAILNMLTATSAVEAATWVPPRLQAQEESAGRAGGAGHRGGGGGSSRPQDTRPALIINDPESTAELTVEAALGYIGTLCPDLYSRDDCLVHVKRDADPVRWIIRPDRAPTISLYPIPCLTVRLCSILELGKLGPKDQVLPISQGAPKWLAAAVDSWPSKHKFGIRHLEAVVTAPTLRADGEILSTPGYDQDSGILFDPAPGITYPAVPPSPSLSDARQAATLLVDVVSDVPFETAAHRSSWFALVLTMAGRLAINGCVPMFAVDANQRGVGKGLLVDIATLIAYGHEPARMALPTEDAEIEKRLIAIALAGDSLVLFDNIREKIGGASIELALTARSIKGRILGVSKSADAPMNTIFAATGNNLSFTSDCARRVIPIRIESDSEEPEARTGFRYPDLRRHVRDAHPSLVMAALTILRAFHVAGRPQSRIPEYGSFTPWSELIRQAIVWLNLECLPDPCITRRALLDAGEEDTDFWRDIIELLPRFYEGETGGVRIGELIKQVKNRLNSTGETFFNQSDDDKDASERMRTALIAVSGARAREMNARSVGKAFARKKKTPVGNNFLNCDSGHSGVNRWFVVHIERQSAGGLGGDGGLIPPTPHARVGERDFYIGETDPPNTPNPPNDLNDTYEDV